jgi:DNA-binding MarR family transcriptional regulator
LYRELTAGQDSPEVRSAVDRYQSSMLMPEWLIKAAVKDMDVTSWPALYALAERAQVTISNLTVRLHRLGIIYIPEGTQDLYPGRDAYVGQKHLF